MRINEYQKKFDAAAVGKMADSTASGELWQQRPYPAPSKFISKPVSKSASIGPSMHG